jgi:hypothetical protein
MRRATILALVLLSACTEKEKPPEAVPLTKEAVEAAAAAKRAAEVPPGASGPWGRWDRVGSGINKPYLRINSVWGTGPKDVWLIGSQRLETVVAHDDGLGFKVTQSFDGEGTGFLGGRSTSDRWIVGSFARHATDSTYEQAIDLVGSRGLRAITSGPEGALWAVGEKGQVVHQDKPDAKWAAEVAGPDVPAYSGGKTTPQHRGEESQGTTKAGLDGIWVGRDLAFAVGEVGTLLRRTPAAGWEPVASGTLEELRSVWGSSPTDVWAVGDRGTILHFSGGGDWQKVSSGTGADLYAIAGSAPNDVWTVGTQGALLHWDGKVWTPIPSGTHETLIGLWSEGHGELWAVGDNSTVLHHVPR